MAYYIPELVQQLDDSDLSEEKQEMAVAFQVEGDERMHHGIEFIVGEMVDDLNSMSDEERVSAFIADVDENYDSYLENHSNLLEEHEEMVSHLLDKYRS